MGNASFDNLNLNIEFDWAGSVFVDAKVEWPAKRVEHKARVRNGADDDPLTTSDG